MPKHTLFYQKVCKIIENDGNSTESIVRPLWSNRKLRTWNSVKTVTYRAFWASHGLRSAPDKSELENGNDILETFVKFTKPLTLEPEGDPMETFVNTCKNKHFLHFPKNVQKTHCFIKKVCKIIKNHGATAHSKPYVNVYENSLFWQGSKTPFKTLQKRNIIFWKLQKITKTLPFFWKKCVKSSKS